jgi:hypothetical protein
METPKQKKWTIDKLSGPWPLTGIVSRWNLDTPKEGENHDHTKHTPIRGWALQAEGLTDHLHIVLQTKGRTLSYPLNAERPDVVQTVLQQDPIGHGQLMCGFALTLPADSAQEGIIVGFETNGLIHPAARISLAEENPPSA